MESESRPKSDRNLGWKTSQDELIPVCDLPDSHLLNCINLMRRRIMGAKLVSGVTSVSILSYRYLREEAAERGLINAWDLEDDANESS